MSEKGKLCVGAAVAVLLIANFSFSLSSRERAPAGGLPIDALFAMTTLFVVMPLLQFAPLAPWFGRRQGAKFGLTAAQRAALTVGMNIVGLPFVFALLIEVLALGAGAGWPNGPGWVFEGMDVASAVVAIVAAGPLGAVILGVRGGRRWLGGGLALLLVGVLGSSAVEPLWSVSAMVTYGTVNGARLVLLAAVLVSAFALEQRSPDDRFARAGKGRVWFATAESRRHRRKAAVDRVPVGIWSRPTFVVALAEARMMLRFRQVRLNLVVSWAIPLFMAFVFRGEEFRDGGAQFALWTAAGTAAFLGVFWVAFFANLLGLTADGSRRLSMSAEKAAAACVPGKVLGALGVAGGLVFAQTVVMSLVLADRIPSADLAIPFLVAAFSLLGLAGGGTVISVWLPRKPKLHEQRDLYCSVLAMVALGCAWLVHVAILGGALVTVRLLGGPRLAVVTMTMLLLVAAAGYAALVALLSRGDWLRRRLREWAVTA